MKKLFKVRSEFDVVINSFETFEEANDWIMQQGQGIQRECWIDDSDAKSEEQPHD
ncbi:hypothetical protein [Rahnella sikkimica]|uniref:hypothetical protein n=1 Tax=Rahnella sikkimica TaxID=1805933 RepID=UPI0018658EB2|nr:hypothetical protein [Rahnella sikkimica]